MCARGHTVSDRLNSPCVIFPILCHVCAWELLLQRTRHHYWELWDMFWANRAASASVWFDVRGMIQDKKIWWNVCLVYPTLLHNPNFSSVTWAQPDQGPLISHQLPLHFGRAITQHCFKQWLCLCRWKTMCLGFGSHSVWQSTRFLHGVFHSFVINCLVFVVYCKLIGNAIARSFS